MDVMLYRTNQYLKERPEPVNDQFTLRVTETYCLESKDLHPSYKLSLPWKEVTLIHEADGTWQVAVKNELFDKIKKKGCAFVEFYLLVGE